MDSVFENVSSEFRDRGGEVDWESSWVSAVLQEVDHRLGAGMLANEIFCFPAKVCGSGKGGLIIVFVSDLGSSLYQHFYIMFNVTSSSKHI